MDGETSKQRGAKQCFDPGFEVVCMLLEEPSIVHRFVNYYVELGASRIRLFFDAPGLPDLGPLPAIVEVTACDSAFWGVRTGERPESLDDRLPAIFLECYKTTYFEWCLFVDADEFVFSDDYFLKFLDRVPPDLSAVSLPTFEAVYLKHDDIDLEFGSTGFRSRWRAKREFERFSRLVYNRETVELLRFGLMGHNVGKQVVRSGRAVTTFGSHHSFLEGKRINVWAKDAVPDFPTPGLAHFDAISFSRWREKWRRRVSGETVATEMGQKRIAQMKLFESTAQKGEDELRALFLQLYGLSNRQLRWLSFFHLAIRREVFAQMPLPVHN